MALSLWHPKSRPVRELRHRISLKISPHTHLTFTNRWAGMVHGIVPRPRHLLRPVHAPYEMLSDVATWIHAENQLWKPLHASWFNNFLIKRSGEITEVHHLMLLTDFFLFVAISPAPFCTDSGTLMMGLRECFTPQKKKVKSGIFTADNAGRRPTIRTTVGIMFRL